MLKFIQTNQAPAAIGPYSQAVLANDTLYVSGQLPFDPKTMALPSSNIEAQTLQSLTNVKAIVEAAGFQLTDVVRCGVFLKDMAMFSQMNGVYQSFFGNHKPARAAVEVARLPKDVLVEIDAICVKSE